MSPPGQHLDARLGLAVASARCASGLSRALGLGGGTAVPGRVATRVDPHVLEKLCSRLGHGAIVIAGTNGKTTTARLVADQLRADHRQVVHNRAGANLVGGIVSTLTAGLPMVRGPSDATTAVLETDEAALPEVLRRASPGVVILTNLFRDQLDRYGEVDRVLDRWRGPLSDLPATTTLVVNGDDPGLVGLTDGLRARRLLFGISDTTHQLAVVPHAGETIACRVCGATLGYRSVFVGHLGHWECPRCGWSRPPLDVSGAGIELEAAHSQSLDVQGIEPPGRFTVALPGLYNTYNVLAALAVARVVAIPRPASVAALTEYRGAFGRAEPVSLRGRTLVLMLVKNPVGCGEVLRTITGLGAPSEAPILLCLNDGPADGRDVSWIWDVDFEVLADASRPVWCAGRRWADLRNRLFYAGVGPDRIHASGTDVGRALDEFTAALPIGGRGFVLPTYSALLEIRETLAKRSRLTASGDA